MMMMMMRMLRRSRTRRHCVTRSSRIFIPQQHLPFFVAFVVDSSFVIVASVLMMMMMMMLSTSAVVGWLELGNSQSYQTNSGTFVVVVQYIFRWWRCFVGGIWHAGNTTRRSGLHHPLGINVLRLTVFRSMCETKLR